MPTYQYRCKECANDLEVVQKFTDASLTECPRCRGELRKVYNAVGVVFKGSGFYATDNRSKNTASVPAGGDAGKSASSSDTSASTTSSSSDSSPSSSSPAPSSSSTTSSSAPASA
ncbi:FmdB family zinc ribbon protein [Propionibacteriaceae bacterium Y1923]|uniref:FmdB family zinc ribbon protein n=1 Tax=Aestuariimicrobium sp. Y1814 TaxID=3418742 RepID=UPI003C295209